MKKIITIIVSLLIFGTVFANDIADKNTYHIEFQYLNGVEDKGVVAEFDQNNILVGAELCSISVDGNVCSTELNMPLLDKKNIRIYFPATQTTIKDFINISLNTDKKDSETVNVNKDDNKNDSDKEAVIAKYPTQLDEVTAFMFVKEANTVSVDDELKTKLTVYFQGRETELYINEDIKISFAPDIHTDLVGESVSNLKRGDVIYCSANLSGKLRTVELIYRPFDGDIVIREDDFGTNFEHLYSHNRIVTSRSTPITLYGGSANLKQQYAFGVIKDVQKNYMTLCNKVGLERQDIIADITPDTVVYVYDNSKRNNKVYIGSIYDIEKSEFYSSLLDDDENVIGWDDSCTHNYALVRMANQTALDIAVYLNY